MIQRYFADSEQVYAYYIHIFNCIHIFNKYFQLLPYGLNCHLIVSSGSPRSNHFYLSNILASKFQLGYLFNTMSACKRLNYANFMTIILITFGFQQYNIFFVKVSSSTSASFLFMFCSQELFVSSRLNFIYYIHKTYLYHWQ